MTLFSYKRDIPLGRILGEISKYSLEFLKILLLWINLFSNFLQKYILHAIIHMNTVSIGLESYHFAPLSECIYLKLTSKRQ